MDQIDTLQERVKLYQRRTGELPRAWSDLVRAGLLNGAPRDPRGFPYALNPYWGTVALGANSTLAPLPTAGPGAR